MLSRLAVLAVLPFVTACKLFVSAPTPMRSLSFPAASGAMAKTTIVLLPGRGDNAETYVENGFITDVRERKLPVDVLCANATFGYYLHENLHERMREDVLGPLFAKNPEHVWLGGISMGGLGSLLLAERQPERFEGILLIAPYLGDDAVLEEIERAGGLAKWTPPQGDTDYQRGVWRYLKTLTSEGAKGPELYLAYGEQDRLVRAHRLLAAALPPERVLRTEGGHDWAPWKRLWRSFLDTWRPPQ